MAWRTYKIHCILLFIIGVALSIPLTGYAEDDYEVGRQHWLEGHYREAYTYLWRYRQEPYGRTAQVDYMLGTSGCRLDDLRDWGCKVLEWLLNRYALPETSRALVMRELELCRSQQITASNPQTVLIVQDTIGASARASGKTFYWLGRDEIFNSYPARHIREIPKEELKARMVPLDDRLLAARKTSALVPGFKVVVYDRFVLATRSGHSKQTLDKMARYLERYLNFLQQEYNFSLPAVFITIYMVPTSDALVKLADRLHGLKVSRATFGYSYRDDMSVVAAIPNDFLIGTIMHELFHLAVRSNFGDIPQWLDEGMASLYEVSRFQDGTVKGIPNWRGKVLLKLMPYRPSLKQMITSDWFAFEQPEYAHEFQGDEYGESPSAEQMAAILAAARYFTLYLQEKGQLREVYQAYQRLMPGEESPDPAAQGVSIIESHLGGTIDSIDTSFIGWFKQTESN